MGYRSDIRIITSKEGYKKLNEFVEQYLKDTEEDNLLKECDIKNIGKEQCYFGWDSVKWYENDFKDVDAIMEGLNHLGENEYSYRYMRIGESYEDIDEQFFDGQKEKDKDVYLEYLSMIREFDDEYIKELISEKTLENEEKNKEEIDI